MQNIPALAIPPTLTPAEVAEIRAAVAWLDDIAQRQIRRDDRPIAARLARRLSAIAARFEVRR